MKRLVVVTCAGLVWGVAGAVALAECPTTTVKFEVGATIVPPSPYTAGHFVDVNTNATVPGAVLVNTPLTDLNLILATTAKSAGDGVRIQWDGPAGTPVCRQAFEVAGSQTPMRATNLLSDCLSSAGALRMRIRNERKLSAGSEDDFSLVVFCQNQGAYQVNGDRDYGVVGEPIFTALYDNGTIVAPSIEFPACALESAGPNVFIGGAFGDIKGVQSAPGFAFVPDPPVRRACYNETVDIVLKGTLPAGPVERRYSLGQAQRYHATLTLGAVFTDQTAHTFGLSPDQDKKNHVFDKGPDGRGPEYLATLVVYALPRQLAQITGKRYKGRDIVHENGFLDRIGGVAGVGITDPTKRFVAGLSFELTRGIHAQLVHRWARLPQLEGVKAGDEFTGTAEQIPVRDRWEHAWVGGVAFDLRYAVALFGRK